MNVLKLKQKLESVLCDPDGNPVIGSDGDKKIIKDCLEYIDTLPKFSIGQRVYYWHTQHDYDRGYPTIFTIGAIRINDNGDYEYSSEGDGFWKNENKLFSDRPSNQSEVIA